MSTMPPAPMLPTTATATTISTTASQEQQLIPATTEANPRSNSNVSGHTNHHDTTVRLSAAEQFMIGIISGGLSALGLSPIKWILYIVVIPSLLLELWEMFQLAFCNPDMHRMRQMKKLRLQQFGHGVISGSGVSHLVADMLFQPSIFTVLNCIMYLCLSICWTLYWTFPTFAEFQKTIANPPQQQPKTLPFFTEQPAQSSSLLQKTVAKKKSSSSKRRKERAAIRKMIELPMGAGDSSSSFALVSKRPQKKVRVASVA